MSERASSPHHSHFYHSYPYVQVRVVLIDLSLDLFLFLGLHWFVLKEIRLFQRFWMVLLFGFL